MKCLLLISLTVLLSACQSLTVMPDYRPYLHDQAFAGVAQVKVESFNQLFHLNVQVTDYLDKQIRPIRDSLVRMQTLNKVLFDPRHLNVIYQASATTTPNQTFRRGQANCLSMSMLAYVMAKYVGLSVTLQEVQIPEYWDTSEQYNLLNGHVNLKMSAPRRDKLGNLIGWRSMVVDFNEVLAGDRFPVKTITPQQIVAMFYNNKGAQALLAGNQLEAYGYFRQAMIIAPDYLPGWSNLGVLYRVSGHLQWAEQVYRQALLYDPQNRTLLDNFAALLERTGRQEQANKIRYRVDKQRQSNPYYHAYLAQQHYDRQQWQQALTEYRQALDLNSQVDSFYFGLAQVYWQLGKLPLARRNLLQARRYADNEQQLNLYNKKLEALNRRLNDDAVRN